MKVFYNNDYIASPTSFETTRKSQFIAQAIKNNKNIEIVDPKDVVRKKVVEQIIKVIHSKKYVDSLIHGKETNLASSSGFEWGKTTYDFAVAHSHGVVASIETAISGENRSGSLSSGLHHASPNYGTGFCTINGLAVGAVHALNNGRKVMILDYDAHCGGGTMSHIENLEQLGIAKKGDIIQIDVSVSPVDSYHSSSPHYFELLNLQGASSDDKYIDAITRSLEVAETKYEPDMLVLYNAGIDPINTVNFQDPFDVLTKREQLVSKWIADKPSCFTLAGGYKWGNFTMEDIVEAHKINIDTWSLSSLSEVA